MNVSVYVKAMAIAGLLLATSAATPTNASLVEVARLTDLGFGTAVAQGGRSVSVYGDYAVAGAPEYSSKAGSALILKDAGNNDWSVATRLTPLVPDAGGYFGGSVSIWGDTVAIASQLATVSGTTQAGKVYIFDRNPTTDTWSQTAILTGSTVQTGARFGGLNVKLVGDTLLVGAYQEDIGAEANAGAVYVFKRETGGWSESGKLTVPGSLSLGHTIAFDGATAMIGAYPTLVDGVAKGKVYVYTQDTPGAFSYVKELARPATDTTGFGTGISLSDGIAVVGAFNDDAGGVTDSGSAFVYAKDQGGTDNWGLVDALVPDDRSTAGAAQFGISSAIVDGAAVVGASLHNQGAATKAGAVYVFEDDGTGNWVQSQVLVPDPAQTNNYFGHALGADPTSSTLMVGSYGYPNGTGKGGAVYVYVPEPSMIVLLLGAMTLLLAWRRR